jgi:hypothetical protein
MIDFHGHDMGRKDGKRPDDVKKDEWKSLSVKDRVRVSFELFICKLFIILYYSTPRSVTHPTLHVIEKEGARVASIFPFAPCPSHLLFSITPLCKPIVQTRRQRRPHTKHKFENKPSSHNARLKHLGKPLSPPPTAQQTPPPTSIH